MYRVKILKLALKRGHFIEFDAKQFYDKTEQHFMAGIEAMVVDDDRSIVADILLEEATGIESQAREIGYTVAVIKKDDARATYRFTLPPALGF